MCRILQLAALLVLWPMISMGGMNRRVTGELQAHKAQMRVQAFFDGKWSNWLSILCRTDFQELIWETCGRPFARSSHA